MDASLPAGIERVVSIEGITEYRLDNGLRLLLLPDASKQTITVNINYLVGSRHEDYGETGMAHLLEHLMFKSSKNHPSIMQELTDHGTRPNGTTWLDRTHYYETFSATDENLEWALDLEADRMVNATLDADDLEREKGVVSNEWMAGENEPSRVLFQRVLSAAYLWHNYGNSTIGALSDINGYPVDRIRAFYRRYYQPDNAVLMVAGDVTTERALELVAAKFGAIPRPERTLTSPYTSEPTQDGERTVSLRRAGDVAEIDVAYHVPDGGHPDAAALDVLSRLLGDTPSGRLYKALVETKLASDAGSYHFSLHDPGLVTFSASVPEIDNIEEVRQTLLATVQATGDVAPPTDEEVNRAKNQLLKQYELMLNSSERVGMGITSYVAMGDWRLLFLRRDRLKAVTVEDVQRVAAAYLKTSNRTVGVYTPTADADRAEIPATIGLTDALDAYAGAEAVSEGEVFEASPENIESRVTRTVIGSGLKLSLLPKRTRGGTVYVSLTFHIGSLEALRGKRTAGVFAAAMLQRGTAHHTRQQLRDAFDNLQASVNIGGGPTEVGGSIETTGPNLAATLALVGEILREPSFPAEEFELLRQERISQLQENRSDPQFIAFTNATRYLLPYEPDDVRYAPTADEAVPLLEAVTVDQAKAYYDTFYGASHGEIAIVGDFDADEIEAQIKMLFGEWQNPTPYARVPRPLPDVSGTFVSTQTPDKSNAVTVATAALPIRDDSPDYPALVIADDILGGGFLSSRLAVRIRQKEGLSYGIGSQLAAGAFDENATLRMYGIYGPENVTKFKTALYEEFERLIADGVTEVEVSAAKDAYLQGESVSRAEDRELASRLANRAYADRTLTFDAKFNQAISELTLEKVNAAIRKYWQPEKIGYFQAGDFSEE